MDKFEREWNIQHGHIITRIVLGSGLLCLIAFIIYAMIR